MTVRSCSRVQIRNLTHEVQCRKQDILRIESDAEATIQTLTEEISRLQLECIAQVFLLYISNVKSF